MIERQTEKRKVDQVRFVDKRRERIEEMQVIYSQETEIVMAGDETFCLAIRVRSHLLVPASLFLQTYLSLRVMTAAASLRRLTAASLQKLQLPVSYLK